MHFLDSWTQLSPLVLARLIFPVALLGLAVFLPGRRTARVTATLVAIAVPFLEGIGLAPALRAAWTALWAGVAWRAGSARWRAPNVSSRFGGMESGLVGLLIVLALIALLVAAVARQDLSPEFGRRASYGLLFMCLGLLHLMLRRDTRRALVAFAGLGFGLQVLERAAGTTLLPGNLPNASLVLVATLVVVGLVERLARVREQDAGSAWVSDAHDLHD
jgi:hypothetical protein